MSRSRPLPTSSELPREAPEPSPPSSRNSRSHSLVSRSNSGHSLSSHTSDFYSTPRLISDEEFVEGKYSNGRNSVTDQFSLASIAERQKNSQDFNIRIDQAKNSQSSESKLISLENYSNSSSAVRREVEAEFFRFARHGHSKELEKLIEMGVSVNSIDSHGNTILIVAGQNGNKRIAKLSLRAGANINHQNKSGNTALHYCWAFQYRELAEYLISKGANPKIKNLLGLTFREGIEKKKSEESNQTQITIKNNKINSEKSPVENPENS